MLTPELQSRLSPLELKARQVVEGFIAGMHKSPFYGFSVEFADHRPYHPGDDLRHVDWKAVGKSGRYYVKRFEEETNLRCHVVLDVSGSMDFRHFGALTKLQYGAYLSASLLYLMHRQRDACGLATFDETLRSFTPARSRYAHLKLLFDQLEPYTHSPEGRGAAPAATDAAEALHRLAERMPRRSLVVLVTDLFDDPARLETTLQALKHLRYRNHEGIVFHLMEKRSEADLELPDGRLMLQDLESGKRLDVAPATIRQAYRDAVESYVDRIRRTCMDAKIDYVPTDTEGEYATALLAYLNKRRRQW